MSLGLFVEQLEVGDKFHFEHVAEGQQYEVAKFDDVVGRVHLFGFDRNGKKYPENTYCYYGCRVVKVRK